MPSAYLQRENIGVDEQVDVGIDINLVSNPSVEMATLKAENTYLKWRIADLETARDAWKEQAQRLALTKAKPQRSWLNRLLGRHV